MTAPDITKELADLRAGLEGVTDGPWSSSPQEGQPRGCAMAQVWGRSGLSIASIEPTSPSDKATALAAHIARCSPERIARLLDHIDALTKERDTANAAREAHAKCTTTLIDQAEARLASLASGADAKPVAWRVRPIGDKVWHLSQEPPRMGYEGHPLYAAAVTPAETAPAAGGVEEIKSQIVTAFNLSKDGRVRTLLNDAMHKLAALSQPASPAPPAPSAPATVAVKALEWRQGVEPNMWVGDGLFGSRWQIVQHTYLGPANFEARFDDEDSGAIDWCKTLEAAKAAAQADYDRRIRAALVEGQNGMEGWKLVPVEPTPEMLHAADSRFSFSRENYRALLAAAPEGEA